MLKILLNILCLELFRNNFETSRDYKNMGLNLGGLGNLKNTFDTVREAKKMEGQMKAQKYTGSSKSQKVTVEVNGLQQLISINISDELCNPLLKDKLEKDIMEAMEDARKSFEKSMMQDMDLGKLKEMLGGLQQ